MFGFNELKCFLTSVLAVLCGVTAWCSFLVHRLKQNIPLQPVPQLPELCILSFKIVLPFNFYASKKILLLLDIA